MVAAIIAFLAGISGVGVGGLLQMRSRHQEQLRERQLNAVDAFAGAGAEVLVALTARLEWLGNPAGREAQWLEEMAEAVKEARSNVHDVMRAAPRLELLFAVGSPTASAALTMTAHLLKLTEELRAPGGSVEVVAAEHNAAGTEFSRFNQRAHTEIAVPAWRRSLGRPATPEVETGAHTGAQDN